jgi:hypothetical protein
VESRNYKEEPEQPAQGSGRYAAGTASLATRVTRQRTPSNWPCRAIKRAVKEGVKNRRTRRTRTIAGGGGTEYIPRWRCDANGWLLWRLSSSDGLKRGLREVGTAKGHRTPRILSQLQRQRGGCAVNDDNHGVENECADAHTNLVGIGMPSPRPPKVPPCESAF